MIGTSKIKNPAGGSMIDSVNETNYNNQGGTKLRLTHPVELINEFDYQNVKGAIRAALAPFGHF